MLLPILIGSFSNWFVPILIGVPDMAFPRWNNLNFWLLLPSLWFLLVSNFLEGGAGTSLTVYPPLGSIEAYFSPAVNFTTYSLCLYGAALLLCAINFIVTIINMRGVNLTFFRFSLFVLFVLIAALLLLLSLSVLTGAIISLSFDRKIGTPFYVATIGADLVWYQYLL